MPISDEGLEYEEDDYYPQDSESEDSDPPWRAYETFHDSETSPSYQINYSPGSSGNFSINFEEVRRQIQDATSGAETEIENPEGEEVPENSNRVRPAPIPAPLNPDIYFLNAATGDRVREGGTVNRNNTVQIQVWSITPERVRSAFAQLKEWMVENEFGVSHYTNEWMYDGDFNATIPYLFTLCDPEHSNYHDPLELFSQPNCSCGAELEYPTLVCPDCDSRTYCGTCRRFSDDVRWDDLNGTFCNNCARSCESCEEIHHGSFERCPTCYPATRCNGCRESIYLNDEETEHFEWQNENGTFYYCAYCFERMCHSCNGIFDPDEIIEDENHQCVTCVSMNSNEEWDEHSELDNESLVIPTIPGREVIRLVGVEIEGANGEGYTDHQGGNMLAEELYRSGLTRNYQMGGYHSNSRGQLVHVERDSSVDWELVIGPINFAEPAHVDTLNKSVRVVRSMINEKTLKLDMRAGLHIHVGADRVPFHNAYNLHKLYMYMEDFLYRFGAAKWPYHRSINRRGRDQAGKSPNVEGKLHFARTFAGQRYYGLSFDNYFARYFEQCGCGARTYGLFDECTCDLGKCTFEFRLFNTTANTVKLHAYLAMCQSLVAKAIDMEEIKNTKEYPALDFVKSRVSDMTAQTKRKMKKEWEKRIVFVNEQLPLTPEEKKSIYYCIMNSELAKLVTNADILLETEDN